MKISSRYIAIFCCLFLFCCGLIASPAKAADPLEIADRALSLVESGDFTAARKALEEVKGEEASSPLIISMCGVVELADGKSQSASSLFRDALAKDPQQLTALWGLCLCLLKANRAFEATALADRAAALAPADSRISTLQAYCYLQLDRVTDAAIASKAALDAGEKSSFLMATLGLVHRRMCYAQKALEFGSFAAREFTGFNYLTPPARLTLPLEMNVIDSPRAIKHANGKIGPDPGITPPDPEQGAPEKKFRIISPISGASLTGMQSVQAVYDGPAEIKFVVFLADRVMRGMSTDLPYQFPWDADMAARGDHQLCMRAYDGRGLLLAEDTVTVKTTAGAAGGAPELPERLAQLQRRAITATMPLPSPFSLYMQLGAWHKDIGEKDQSLRAFEKAAAIDPTCDEVLKILETLYKESGLHPISATGQVTRGMLTGKKLVALTFDDGPNPLYTPTILDELDKYNARSTFFLVGKMAQQFPDLTLEMLAKGHELANHTYTHPNLTRLKQLDIITEVLRTRAVIKDITGKPTYLFRPPGGNIDEFVTKQLRALDYNIVYWDINAGDFKKYPPDGQVAQIITRVQDGSIILLHNGPVDGTMAILPKLLQELRQRGFKCVTVTELMNAQPK